MASPANLLRLSLRTSRRLPILRAAATQQPLLRRQFSSTPPRPAAKDGGQGVESEPETFADPGQYLKTFLRDDTITEAEREEATRMLEGWEHLPKTQQREIETVGNDITTDTAPLRKQIVVKRDSFWHGGETDPDLITNEIGEDDFEEDDMMALGHAKLEEHREFREYARLAVWEMPLLSKLAKPFQPPAQEEVLRFRYTTYMGEFHPADRKVVVEFCPADCAGLGEVQQLKLKKLAGARYNPEKDMIKISCERFEHQAQNKRYLGDLVDKMITTAKDPTDTFEDVPLDTRHHKFKTQIKFPKDWYLTEERKLELAAQRKQALLLDEQKRTEGTLIDGVQTIQEALLNAKAVEELVPVMRGRPLKAPVRGRR
ncbi:mitochondrial ribosomal protein [Trichocladium antarcticum]|uniref:Mitochondrial ribosomal protein n=1 Tax=Trichocladium antarcticum TaxID=1450529 RepID=A0AAN6UJP5_9PEZI|nr:mitochondrial ribosomal protein [Trichocladium antarcticum]